MSTAATTPYPENERLYGITEVSRLTDLKTSVLRYWESEIPLLQPVKSHNGHRMYRQQDLDLVLKIKQLLYEEGFTIAGARRHLSELAIAAGAPNVAPAPLETVATVAEPTVTEVPESDPIRDPLPIDRATAQLNRKILLELRDALRDFLTLLERK